MKTQDRKWIVQSLHSFKRLQGNIDCFLTGCKLNMSWRKQNLTLNIVIACATVMQRIYGHSYDVTCSSTMALCGHSRLGRATTAGSGTVKLTRAGTALACGSSLNGGETLGLATASLVGEVNQHTQSTYILK